MLTIRRYMMRGDWTSVGSMYLGRQVPLLFPLFSNPHSSKTESEDDKTYPTFSGTLSYILAPWPNSHTQGHRYDYDMIVIHPSYNIIVSKYDLSIQRYHANPVSVSTPPPRKAQRLQPQNKNEKENDLQIKISRTTAAAVGATWGIWEGYVNISFCD